MKWKFINGWMPGLALLMGYQREWLTSDIRAGLSVAAVAVARWRLRPLTPWPRRSNNGPARTFDGLPLTGPGGTPYELFEPLWLSRAEVLRGARFCRHR